MKFYNGKYEYKYLSQIMCIIKCLCINQLSESKYNNLWNVGLVLKYIYVFENMFLL